MPTIMITGANRGLGLEFVRQYAAEGWRVLAVVRDPLSGRAASEAGGEVYVCDIGDPGSVTRLAAATDKIDIDILLNNAGTYGERQAFGSVDADEFLRVMRINAVGPLKVAEAFAGRMTGRKIIACMSSMMGSIADNTSGGSYAYRASKAALNMVVKGMAIELAPQGVIAVALLPGWVKTDMGGPNAPLDAVTAVSGMRAVLDGIGLAESGRFFHYDGREVPW